MTGNTAKPPAKRSQSVSAAASIITDTGFAAAFAAMAGVALHRGFGVSVPFVAAWLLLLTFMWLAQLVTGQLAHVWHRERVKADINLVAASMAAQEAIQGDQVAGLRNFLARMGEDSAKSDGGYL